MVRNAGGVMSKEQTMSSVVEHDPAEKLRTFAHPERLVLSFAYAEVWGCD
jgi:hypothetical protein